MDSFLKDVAIRLINDHPNDLDQVLVVFNNRRPSLFLRREFKNLSDRAYFLPQILGMDDLIASLGQFSITPNEFLLFELFDIHRSINHNSEKFSTFESFMPMADMMMSDFSEIDLYMVDAESLFSNLHDLKAIGEWNIEEPKLTDFQRNYLQFYKSLYTYYSQLRSRLLDQKKAYSGMAYRHVAEHIDALIGKLPYKQIYFVGFGLLSTSERTIVEALIRQGKAQLITDGDAYYCNQPEQEAGQFFRQIRELLPDDHQHPDLFSHEDRNISVISCPEDILQAKYTGQLLRQWTESESPNSLGNTALVLADENLLLPVLNSLPDGVLCANITMGFPYSMSGFHAFVLKLISLHVNAKNKRFYHRDLLDTLSDAYIGKILGISNLYPKLKEHLASEKVIYSDLSYVDGLFRSINIDISPIRFLFDISPASPDTLLQAARHLSDLLLAGELLQNNVKEREAVKCFIEICDYLEQLQSSYHFIQELPTFEKIYSRLAQRHSISFFGKPLKGLQILGMLETRNLNFDRIVILSTNEGTLPTGRSNNTLIPFSLKRIFGIPTHEDKDAVYAYHFYRLLQRAKEVHLLYNTETEGMSKGEASRFILQIRSELAASFPNIHISEKVLSVSNVSAITPSLTEIPKSDPILLRLNQLAEAGLSPTLLNSYRRCPRQFYYRYILDIKDPEDIKEDLDSSELGSCIHEVLREIYESFGHSPISPEDLEKYVEEVPSIVDQKFEDKFLKGRSGEGRNHLLSSVAKEQIISFLKYEIATLRDDHKLNIVHLERDLKFPLRIQVNSQPKDIFIKGRIDRIDHFDRRLRIMDYKSGKVTPSELSPNRDTPQGKISDKWLQLLVYAWLYAHTPKAETPIETGIIALQSGKTKYLSIQWGATKAFEKEDLLDFQEFLQTLVEEILNPDIPFRCHCDHKVCGYCSFSSICPQTSMN